MCVFVCVYVCVCVCTLSPRFLSSARCLRHTWGYESTMLCWVSFPVLLPSSFISVFENVIFHLQRGNSSLPTNWRKMMIYLTRKKMIYIRKNIFTCLFSVHNAISLSRHEQVCLIRLRFERYFSHHRTRWWEKYLSKSSLNILVHDVINLLYFDLYWYRI